MKNNKHIENKNQLKLYKTRRQEVKQQ